MKKGLIGGIAIQHCLWLVLLIPPVFAQTSRDTVRWDDRAFQWVYILHDPADDSQYKEIRYTPRGLIDPQVKSVLRKNATDYEYGYRIRNQGGARQSISDISVLAPVLIDSIPKIPPPVANETSDQAVLRVRRGADIQDAWVAKMLRSPANWHSFLNTRGARTTTFGWLRNFNEDAVGIRPGNVSHGFSITRPELPGVGWMLMQGDTPDSYKAASLPRYGALSDHVEKIFEEDFVSTAVLVPAITVPVPYDNAELVRRLQQHVGSWSGSELLSEEFKPLLNKKFDQIIAAIQYRNKKMAQVEIVGLLTDIFRAQRGMVWTQAEVDDESQDTLPEVHRLISDRGTLMVVRAKPQQIHRVAARALIFDLMFVLTKIEKTL